MSISVRVTPQGHKIITQAVAATIGDDGGYAKVTLVGHGLTTGDFVFIDSSIENYNGFFSVGVDDADSFFISGDLSFVSYYQDADINYYQTSPHDWSCIFLPIVYKLSNNRWPDNQIDTAPQSVSTVTNDNGYARLTYGSNLRSSSIRALEYIEITGTDYDGVYQIIEKISDTNIVINLAYSSAVDSSVSGGSINYYYNNYQILVKVYGGLGVSHPMVSHKPYELLATLSFTPDDDNLSMFSISDIIKSKVEIKNNLGLFSLPLNLDAFTQFKIEYAEAYDYSDGYAIYRHVDPYTADTFEGYASTSQLPFKNTNSGWMSDYVYVSGEPGFFLINQTRLMGVAGYYFDVSFIKNIEGDFNVVIDKYIAGYLTATETVPYTDKGIGVYRVPIELDSTYDSFCVRIQLQTEDFTPAEFPPVNDWANISDGDYPWINPLDGTRYLAMFPSHPANASSDRLRIEYTFDYTKTYTFRLNMGTVILGVAPMYLILTDSVDSVLATYQEDSPVMAPAGPTPDPFTVTFVFTPPVGTTYFSIRWAEVPASTVNWDPSIVLYSIDNLTPSSTEEAFTLVEEICIDIVAPCDIPGFTPTEDNIRLTEDGDFRILE